MSYKLSRDLFDSMCKHVVFDEKLCRTIELNRVAFTVKNNDHIHFLGGNLTGTYKFVFSTNDRMRWFDEVIQMDEQSLRDEIIHLPNIDKNHKVSSDTFNLSCVWVIHRLQKANLPQRLKEQAMRSTALMMIYRMFTSRYGRHFKYLTDRATALATYNALSNKFYIKRFGNWNGVFNEYAEVLVGPNSLHKRTIVNMDNDIKVVYMLNDTQNRQRAMLKTIYGVFLHVHDKGIKVYSNSATVEYEGESMFRDKKEGVTKYTTYLKETLISEESFIKPELTAIIEDAMPTVSPRMLRDTLTWISENVRLDRSNKISEALDKVVEHAYEVVYDDRLFVSGKVDLNALLLRLRGIYTASRNTEPKVLFIRKELETIAKKAIKTSNKAALASVRTGVALYVVLRVFTMTYYTRRG